MAALSVGVLEAEVVPFPDSLLVVALGFGAVPLVQPIRSWVVGRPPATHPSTERRVERLRAWSAG